MIDLKNKQITRGKYVENIKCFEVWFLVMGGLCPSLDEALSECQKLDIDSLMIRPVSVAIGINGHYEVFMR